MTMRRVMFSGVVGLGLLGLLAGLAGVVRAEAVKDLPKPTTYVNDFAGVIDAASKQQMETLAAEVAAKAHATIVVVTVKSLDGVSIEEFSTDLEDKWRVGPKGTDKGVLMVFAIGDHKRRIEVGYGLEGALNDAKVGDIGRSMVPQLQAGQYGPAILGGMQQIAQDIAGDAGVTLTTNQAVVPPVYRPQPATRSGGVNWFKIVVWGIILIVLLSGGGRGGGWIWFLLGNMMGGGFGGGGRGRDGDGDGFGGGGGGGGGDFGGGFGGGSGGGGASGDW